MNDIETTGNFTMVLRMATDQLGMVAEKTENRRANSN